METLRFRVKSAPCLSDKIFIFRPYYSAHYLTFLGANFFYLASITAFPRGFSVSILTLFIYSTSVLAWT